MTATARGANSDSSPMVCLHRSSVRRADRTAGAVASYPETESPHRLRVIADFQLHRPQRQVAIERVVSVNVDQGLNTAGHRFPLSEAERAPAGSCWCKALSVTDSRQPPPYVSR